MSSVKHVSPTEVCERIKKLGYSVGRHIQLYGERMEVVSDPFVREGQIAVRVRTRGDASERVLYLPTKFLLGVG